MDTTSSKYKPRIIDKILSQELEGMGAVLIQGAKWCGKTTSSKRHAASEIVLDSSEEGRDLILRAEAMPSDLLGKEPPSAYRRMAERP